MCMVSVIVSINPFGIVIKPRHRQIKKSTNKDSLRLAANSNDHNYMNLTGRVKVAQSKKKTHDSFRLSQN